MCTELTSNLKGTVQIPLSMCAMHSHFPAIFSEHKLAGRCAELLAEAIATFPENSPVVSWCSYALLQLDSGSCGGVVSGVMRGSQLSSYCQNPPVSLSKKARGYLKQLGVFFHWMWIESQIFIYFIQHINFVPGSFDVKINCCSCMCVCEYNYICKYVSNSND